MDESEVQYELCEVEGFSAELPTELLSLPNLDEVLSLEAWNEYLSDEDRSALAPYLPDLEGEDLQEALQDLLSGYNILFGNPRNSLYGMLASGLCKPEIANLKKSSQILQRRRHCHNVRDYHNKVVNRIWQMQKIWKLYKDRPFEEKLHFLKLPLKAETEPHGSQKKRKSVSMDAGKRTPELMGKELFAQTMLNASQIFPTEGKSEDAADSDDTDLPPLNAMDKILGFSIVHLLSAIRSAFLKTRGCGLEEFEWLTVDDIAERVQDSPGDARILSGKYVLRDLVQHSLLVLQTKAPPGTRLWKPFVQQRKGQQRDWSWCGVVPIEDEDFEVVHTEHEFWGVNEKAFAKLRERLVVSVTSTNLNKLMPGSKKGQNFNFQTDGQNKIHNDVKKSPALTKPEGSVGNEPKTENAEAASDMSTPKSITEKQESESFNHASLSESLDTFLNPSNEPAISNFDGLKMEPKPSSVIRADERTSSLLPENLRLMSGLISGTMAARMSESKTPPLQNTSIMVPSIAQETAFPSYQRYEHAIAEQEHQERNGVNVGEFLNTSDIFDPPYYKTDFPPQLAAHSFHRQLPEYHSPYLDATKLAQMNAHMQQAQGSSFVPEGSQGTNYAVKK